MPREIKEGAIFIADAHYPHYGDTLLTLLKSIENQTLKTPQLFLMGDIFDLLFGYNEYIKKFSKELIELLQKLSQDLEIHYVEGNHDFCLKEIFPNIHLYPREKQPIKFQLKEQRVYLAHGDLYETGFGYNLYSKFLRNKTTLTLLKPFEKQIINHRIKKLQEKNICHPFERFEQRAKAIISHYPKDALIIEGHFHQGIKFENYISLPSLVCQNKIAIVQNGQLVFRKKINKIN